MTANFAEQNDNGLCEDPHSAFMRCLICFLLLQRQKGGSVPECKEKSKPKKLNEWEATAVLFFLLYEEGQGSLPECSETKNVCGRKPVLLGSALTNALVFSFVFTTALRIAGQEKFTMNLLPCTPPRKSLVKGERFIRDRREAREYFSLTTIRLFNLDYFRRRLWVKSCSVVMEM